MPIRTLRLLFALIAAGAAVAPLQSAGPAKANAARDEFSRKAAGLFHKTYFFHAWNETEHTVAGEDWSLPPGVKAAPYSGIQIDSKLVSADFPARFQRSVRAAWREIEPREGERDFGPFRGGDETALCADAELGGYRGLLEKLLLIQALGGMATEVVAITTEGILVAKQVLGDPLPQGDDMSGSLPAGLIEIPSRFLRANRDHPRLFFLQGRPWLVADLHARNFVRGSDGRLRVIDLVAAPWPVDPGADGAEIRTWIERVRRDPRASALPAAPDDEL